MTTDFRALCAELLLALESWSPGGGGPLEGQEAEKEARLIERARAALAEPESIEDRIAKADAAIEASMERVRKIAAPARAALAEGDGPAVPVPVSERVPEAEDCDEQGRCWLLTYEDDYPQWRLQSIQGAQPGGVMIWVPVASTSGDLADCFYTSHWLPANAVPLPSGKGEP